MSSTTQSTNPLDGLPMRSRQILVVSIMVLLNALDGFDILSISFAGPYIAEEWAITMAQLGFVFSAELFGMAVGSIFLGNVADKIGRRPLILMCLVVMAIGMFLASTARGIYDMSAFRVFTGLGIGGMLASTNAMTAEFANAKFRKQAITIMVAGYPLGVVFGGMAANQLVEVTGDWRNIFIFGAIVTAVMIPVVWILVPESIEFLNKKRGNDALDKVNRVLKALGHKTLSNLPAVSSSGASKSSITDLFQRKFFAPTILLTLTYFMTVVTFYFILKWVPKLVKEMGFGNPGSVLVWASIGGFLGCILFGTLARRFSTKKLTIFSLAMTFIGVAIFGQGADNINHLKAVTAFAGFFSNAAIVGMYTMFALYFPAEIRASGTGFRDRDGARGRVSIPDNRGLHAILGLGFGHRGRDYGGGRDLWRCVPHVFGVAKEVTT